MLDEKDKSLVKERYNKCMDTLVQSMMKYHKQSLGMSYNKLATYFSEAHEVDVKPGTLQAWLVGRTKPFIPTLIRMLKYYEDHRKVFALDMLEAYLADEDMTLVITDKYYDSI